jgi:DNA repair exonuclease SbcCD nuclease subunit
MTMFDLKTARRVLVLGDTHANVKAFAKVSEIAHELEVDAIIQVGDFGFGYHGFEDGTCLWSYGLWSFGIPVFWIDGNHEFHDELDRYRFEDRKPVHEIVEVAPLCYHIPRGTYFQIGTYDCLAFGGAVSVDQEFSRRNGRPWFPQEGITTAEYFDWRDDVSEVDILFTHDAPTSPTIKKMGEATSHYWPKDVLEQSAQHRVLIDNIRKACDPTYTIHGHWHFRYDESDVGQHGQQRRIIGLDKDGSHISDQAVLITYDPDTNQLDVNRIQEIA